MNQVIRSNGQWEAINRALDAGPGSLTAGMYQDAVVAQVQTDTPELWPLGPIEGTSPAVYMATGAWEEWGETLERDQTNPGYHRLAKLVLPSDVSYPFDEPHAIDRHVKEFGDLSWYVANILASALDALAERLAARVAPGGRIALSGILKGQEDELLARYAPWFDELSAAREGDWMRIDGVRR